MPKKTTDYATLKAQLDNILANLQAGELDIDKATVEYQQGMKLIQEMEQYLKTAENKIEKVKQQLKNHDS